MLELYLMAEAIDNYGDSYHHSAILELMHKFSADYALKCCNKAYIRKD